MAGTAAGSAGVSVPATAVDPCVVAPINAAPGDLPGTGTAYCISCSKPRISSTIAVDRVWDASVSADTESSFACHHASRRRALRRWAEVSSGATGGWAFIAVDGPSRFCCCLSPHAPLCVRVSLRAAVERTASIPRRRAVRNALRSVDTAAAQSESRAAQRTRRPPLGSRGAPTSGCRHEGATCPHCPLKSYSLARALGGYTRSARARCSCTRLKTALKRLHVVALRTQLTACTRVPQRAHAEICS